jgi:hypothetical protein
VKLLFDRPYPNWMCCGLSVAPISRVRSRCPERFRIYQAAFRDFGAAMRHPALRFWAVEHRPMTLVAVVLVQVVGRVLARTTRTTAMRRARQIVCFAVATVPVVPIVSWPGLANGRPLLRF